MPWPDAADRHIAAGVVCHPRGSGSHQYSAIDWELDLPRVRCGAGYVGIRGQVGWLDGPLGHPLPSPRVASGFGGEADVKCRDP